MCHTNGEADQSHQAHVNSSATVGYNAACTDCHGAGTASASAPTAGHINGTFAAGGAQTIRGYATTLTYSGFTYPTVKGTCGTNICHNAGYSVAGPALQPPKTAVYSWGTQIANCDACHDTVYNLLATFSHTRHLTTTTGGTDARLCGNCHIAASNANHMNRTVNMGGTAITLDATYTGDKSVLTPALYGTCGINACHNNGVDSATGTPRTAAYSWATAIAGINSCDECHGDTVGTLTTQAHAAHLNASATFGITTIACASCHGASAEQQTAHPNGSVTLVGLTYATGDIDLVTPNTYGTCGVNVCHNDGTGVTQQSNPLWSASGLTCVNCHQDGAAMITNAHNEHTQYTNMLCTDCHAAATAATHINGSTNLAAAVTYLKGASFPNDAGAAGTCTTSACHNRSVASVGWDQAALACTSCHGNGSGQSMSGSHDPHLVFGKVCNDCHAAAADTTHISTRPANLTSSANATTGEAGVVHTGVTWTSPNCTYSGATGCLGCHATGNAQLGRAGHGGRLHRVPHEQHDDGGQPDHGPAQQRHAAVGLGQGPRRDDHRRLRGLPHGDAVERRTRTACWFPTTRT